MRLCPAPGTSTQVEMGPISLPCAPKRDDHQGSDVITPVCQLVYDVIGQRDHGCRREDSGLKKRLETKALFVSMCIGGGFHPQPDLTVVFLRLKSEGRVSRFKGTINKRCIGIFILLRAHGQSAGHRCSRVCSSSFKTHFCHSMWLEFCTKRSLTRKRWPNKAASLQRLLANH